MGAHGSFWGLLVGILLLNPLAGVILGGAVGAAVGSLRHLGIEDSFLKALGAEAQPGTSLLFLLESEADPSSVFNELKKFDGKVLRTSFEFGDEEDLRKALTEKK
jgi:uncharacterized membrane protein